MGYFDKHLTFLYICIPLGFSIATINSKSFKNLNKKPGNFATLFKLVTILVVLNQLFTKIYEIFFFVINYLNQRLLSLNCCNI